MSENVLLVKNMVCRRCLLAVENVLANASISYQQVIVGEIHLVQPLSAEQYVSVSSCLAAIGLELIDNRTSGLIEKIKQLVIKKVRKEVDDKEHKMNLSAYLSQNLYHEYTYLSSLFSSVEGRTIENYFIQQRIEKVKELLVYNEMTLSAIAFEMDYSSVAHLSNQFKQITGLTPSHFKKVGSAKRKLLDQL
ncbi:helix-turn-helix domain-containing protein [Flavisolibacter ginsengisoli]|uniref:Transcriptional regulator, AraC family n=1 Tax=Flavisolibacter ginsengisoli DSM 18119 TaxID=1121884 RepID=A0A1M5DJV5_9BACT|nr:helix-turn-helix domain-containing protein [Flavisolibacter ginsengisoli]SHF67279.1 transcriptional regulator, AraC family [Flavisolibacter ginsengisoli DSM 18119]